MSPAIAIWINCLMRRFCLAFFQILTVCFSSSWIISKLGTNEIRQGKFHCHRKWKHQIDPRHFSHPEFIFHLGVSWLKWVTWLSQLRGPSGNLDSSIELHWSHVPVFGHWRGAILLWKRRGEKVWASEERAKAFSDETETARNIGEGEKDFACKTLGDRRLEDTRN